MFGFQVGVGWVAVDLQWVVVVELLVVEVGWSD
jgi:hypothetical protein